MDTSLSVAAILSSLEEQIARQREQETFHAEREAFHRERGAECAAEMERMVRSLEAFKASAANAAELATRHLQATAAPKPADDLPPGRKVSLSKAVVKVIEGKEAQEPFGSREVTEEINRRFGKRRRKTIDPRQVSVSLRWLASTGRIFRLAKGRPHWESKYVRQRPPK